MRRYSIVGAIVVVIAVLFLWTRRRANTTTSEASQATNSQAMVAQTSNGEGAAVSESSAPQKDEIPAGIPEAELERIRREKAYVEQLHNQDHNVPIAFY